MKTIILIICLILLSHFSYAEKVYQIYLEIYKNDTVNLLDSKVTEEIISIPSSGEGEDYAFKIFSKDEKLLFKQQFKIGFYAYLKRLANSTETDEILIKVRYRYFNLPYFENADKIQLFHENKLIWEHNIKDEIIPKTTQNNTLPIAPPKNTVEGNSNILIAVAIGVVILTVWALFWLRKRSIK